MCCFKILDEYLKVTKKRRIDETYSQLLQSTLSQHKSVIKCTIAGWIRTTLGNAGFDTSKFTAHSASSISSFKVGLKALPVHEILKRCNWSCDST